MNLFLIYYPRKSAKSADNHSKSDIIAVNEPKTIKAIVPSNFGSSTYLKSGRKGLLLFNRNGSFGLYPFLGWEGVRS